MKKISLQKRLSVLSAALCALPVWSMSIMNDGELSTVDGQSLVTLSYLAPTDAGNFESANNIGFYKLGFEADVEANLNMKKLQLGCGGVNGAGACDLDIDNFSLSGNPASTGNAATDRNNRVQSDALLRNPFFQFAIKSPNSASNREVVGLRVSAEQTFGLLTFGTENADTPSGINSYSGYMSIGSATGAATTQTRNMTPAQTGKDMTGRINITDLGANLNFTSSTYNLALTSATATVTTTPTVVSGTRMSSVNLSGTATIAPISFSGSMTATLLGFVNLDKTVTGSISGLTATVPITQNLGFIHKIPLAGNPFGLSLQGQAVHWPGAAQAAQKGWWMAFEDQIDIGNITPANTVPITDAVLSQALGPEGCSNGATPGINCALYANPISCRAVGSPNCFGGSLPVGNVDITGTNVIFPLNDLKLSAQSFAPNCYGTLKFC